MRDPNEPPPLPNEKPTQKKGIVRGCGIGCGALIVGFIALMFVAAYVGSKEEEENRLAAVAALDSGDYEKALDLTEDYRDRIHNKEYQELIRRADEMKLAALVERIRPTEGDERESLLRELLKLDPDTAEFPDEIAAIREADRAEALARQQELEQDRIQREEDAVEKAMIEAEHEKARIAEESAARVSGITWREFNAIYDINSKYTDLQKEAEWERFKDKTVEWTGEVTGVDDGRFAGLRMQVRMDRDTFTFDLYVSLRDEFRDKAMKLKVGDRVTFRGELSRWGTLTATSIKNGMIVD